MKINFIAAAVAAFCFVGGAASAATLDGIGTFEGVAGVGSSNGDVGDNASGSQYIYVTTAGSTYDEAGLDLAERRTDLS